MLSTRIRADAAANLDANPSSSMSTRLLQNDEQE
jgi:hypothetical protein